MLIIRLQIEFAAMPLGGLFGGGGTSKARPLTEVDSGGVSSKDKAKKVTIAFDECSETSVHIDSCAFLYLKFS